jgi:hypothetical protein
VFSLQTGDEQLAVRMVLARVNSIPPDHLIAKADVDRLNLQEHFPNMKEYPGVEVQLEQSTAAYNPMFVDIALNTYTVKTAKEAIETKHVVVHKMVPVARQPHKDVGVPFDPNFSPLSKPNHQRMGKLLEFASQFSKENYYVYRIPIPDKLFSKLDTVKNVFHLAGATIQRILVTITQQTAEEVNRVINELSHHVVFTILPLDTEWLTRKTFADAKRHLPSRPLVITSIDYSATPLVENKLLPRVLAEQSKQVFTSTVPYTTSLPFNYVYPIPTNKTAQMKNPLPRETETLTRRRERDALPAGQVIVNNQLVMKQEKGPVIEEDDDEVVEEKQLKDTPPKQQPKAKVERQQEQQGKKKTRKDANLSKMVGTSLMGGKTDSQRLQMFKDRKNRERKPP